MVYDIEGEGGLTTTLYGFEPLKNGRATHHLPLWSNNNSISMAGPSLKVSHAETKLSDDDLVLRLLYECLVVEKQLYRVGRRGALHFSRFSLFSSLFTFASLSSRTFQYAFVTLTGDNFYGAHTFSNVWHPATYNDEYSIAQIWVIAGNAKDQDHFDALEVGWVVTEGDDLTRLLIHWTSDGYQKTGCFNIDCPGFVLIDRSFAFGGALTPVSTYNGNQLEIQFNIKKDNESGNWWVGVAERILGYWPGSLFTGLADHATAVILGGEVLNKNVDGHHTTTQMGTSYDVKIVEHTNGTYFYYGGPEFSFNCL
ncbi:hypothetical protein ACOSP7_020267 [Xanthoceras sorbifolium]